MKESTLVAPLAANREEGSLRPFIMAAIPLIAAMLWGCSAGHESVASANVLNKSQTDSEAALVPGNSLSPKLTMPKGTHISIRLLQALHSQTAAPGSEFLAEVAAPIQIDGATAFAKGTRVKGRVVDARPSGRFRNPGYLKLTLDSIQVADGDWQNLRTNSLFLKGGSHKKRNATLIGGGAGVGGLIGGLAGGAKGLGIGLASGAGAGVAGAFVSGKKDITYAAESQLNFTLAEPIAVTPKQ